MPTTEDYERGEVSRRSRDRLAGCIYNALVFLIILALGLLIAYLAFQFSLNEW